MGLEVMIPIALAAAGTGASAYSNYGNAKNAEAQRRRNQQLIEQFVLPTLQGGPGKGEGMMEQLLGEWMPTTGGQGFNTGQDALMQMLRSRPQDRTQDILEGIAEGGAPFDASGVFKTLRTLDDRKRKEAIAGLRSGASGLGQRFGTAQRAAEGDMLSQLLEGEAARDEQIAMQSYEAAQGRRMGAVQMLGQRDQQTAGIAQLLAQLGLQQGGLAQQDRGQQMQGIMQLIQAASARRGQTMQGLSFLTGQPAEQGYNPGEDVMGLAQLLLLAGNL